MSSSGSRDRGIEEGSSGGPNRCRHPGCNKHFHKPHDLIRHEATHDPNSPKRRCPFSNSGCRIQVGEMQLSNWFEHIVTIHGKYTYACEECAKSWPHRKALYEHKGQTGHSCLPKDWSSERRESELEARDQCYRRARAELLRMRETGKGEWDDEWPEILPEYVRFKHSKYQKASPRRIKRAAKHPLPEATPGSPVPFPSTSTCRDTLGVVRRPHRTPSYHPYVRLTDPLVGPSGPSSHKSLRPDSGEIFPMQFPEPGYLTPVATLNPLTPLGQPVPSTFAPGDQILTSLEAHSPSLPDPGPERAMTREEVDYLFEIVFPGGPPAWDIMAQIPTDSPVSTLSETPSEIMASTPCGRQGPDAFSELNSFDDYFLMGSESR